MAVKPKSMSENELDKAEAQFKEFDNQVKAMTMDRMNETSKQEVESQTKMSQKDMEKSNEIYLKPHRSFRSQEKFNEDYRKEWEFAKEYVNFIAENREIIGEEIDMWTKPFAGVPCEEWKIPVNKPIWAPRYVAEQLKRAYYHRLKTEDRPTTGVQGGIQQYGTLVIDTTVQRLDAIPVSPRKSIFMGASSF